MVKYVNQCTFHRTENIIRNLNLVLIVKIL